MCIEHARECREGDFEVIDQTQVSKLLDAAFPLLAGVTAELESAGVPAHITRDGLTPGPHQIEIEVFRNGQSFEFTLTVQPVGPSLDIWASIHDADGACLRDIGEGRYSDVGGALGFVAQLARDGAEAIADMFSAPRVAAVGR